MASDLPSLYMMLRLSCCLPAHPDHAAWNLPAKSWWTKALALASAGAFFDAASNGDAVAKDFLQCIIDMSTELQMDSEIHNVS